MAVPGRGDAGWRTIGLCVCFVCRGASSGGRWVTAVYLEVQCFGLVSNHNHEVKFTQVNGIAQKGISVSFSVARSKETVRVREGGPLWIMNNT